MVKRAALNEFVHIFVIIIIYPKPSAKKGWDLSYTVIDENVSQQLNSYYFCSCRKTNHANSHIILECPVGCLN